MRGHVFGIAIALVAMVPTAGTRADDEPVPQAEPPRAEPVAPGEAAPSEPAPPLPREPAADGTTSVVVPLRTGGPAPETPPAIPSPPTAPPVQTPPATPTDLPQPPPQSEAAMLLARMLEPLAAAPGRPVTPAETSLHSRPLPLLEALSRGGDRSRRLWIVQAYWKVSTGYAALRSATEALQRLELVAPGPDPHDRATLDVATAAARADLADARARLGAAQQELVDLARLPTVEPLPWPVDRPLADPYQTHFETIFANRLATGRVRAIVRGLPARHEAVAARAGAVVAAERAMAMAETDHARGNRPIEAVVAAHTALVGQQAGFLEATRTYNLEIAEYAMAVAELSLPDDQFVSMLIGTPIHWRQQRVEPVAAVLPPAATAEATPTLTPPPPLAPAGGPAE